jgi:predicted secreted protein
MARLNGTDLILSVEGVAIAHATSNSFSSEMAMIDVSSKDSSGNQENIAGQKSFSIDFEGLTDFGASGYGFDNLFELLNNKTEIDWIFGADGTPGGTEVPVAPKLSGKGYISSLSLDAPMEDASTYSGSITVTGAVTYAGS